MRQRYASKKKQEKRKPGEAPLLNDEWRTPEGLGKAMAAVFGREEFSLDPFAPHHGFSGIPAKQTINWKQDAYKTTPEPFDSIGFNVPFSEPRKALNRIAEFSEMYEDVVMCGIVRSDTSVAWWHDCVVDSGLYSWCVFTPRIPFMTMEGIPTGKTPSGGVAIIGNRDAGNRDGSEAVFNYVKKTYGRAMWTRF
jgi:hypothetical protein